MMNKGDTGNDENTPSQFLAHASVPALLIQMTRYLIVLNDAAVIHRTELFETSPTHQQVSKSALRVIYSRLSLLNRIITIIISLVIL